MIVKFEVMDGAAIYPILEPQKPGDVGFDLRAAKNGYLLPGHTEVIRTGVKIQMPEGIFGMIRDRSSIAATGVITAAGIVDQGYTGELKVVLINISNSGFAYDIGARIAQIIFLPYVVPLLAQVTKIEPTERGESGFGSTGKN